MPAHWKDKVNVRELDYFNKEGMVEAFKGIDTVVFIPSIIHPSCLLVIMQINIIIHFI